MDVVVTKEQLDRVIPNEDIEFVKAWKKLMDHYPKFRELQQDGRKVGDILPTHPKKNIKLKSYVDLYLGKFLNYIIAKLVEESGESIEKHVRGAKSYVSKDAKEILRSELEVLAYNIFVLEGLENEIEVDSKRFLKTCNKIPDFVWEEKKIVIEIAGMEDKEYFKKLEGAEKCFENLGYKVLIIESRPFEKQSKYVNFYKYFCDLLGFKMKKEVVEAPYKYLGYSEVNREMKQKYIDENINKLPLTTKQHYYLNKYINQLYGYGIKKYKMEQGMRRFRHSIDKNDIRKFKSENPTMSNKEIAKHFGVTRNTIQQVTAKMKNEN